jgi:hypothetical protein
MGAGSQSSMGAPELPPVAMGSVVLDDEASGVEPFDVDEVEPSVVEPGPDVVSEELPVAVVVALPPVSPVASNWQAASHEATANVSAGRTSLTSPS